MRVLISAYACEPNKGSEPGVGWNWVAELTDQGHCVWVITRSNNRSAIDTALAEHPRPNLQVRYVDLPKDLSRWKKGRRGIHLYYLLWQIAAFRLAWRLTRQMAFDRIHHVTFVSVRQPSFLGLLGSRFVFGPVAGGERIPSKLRQGLPWRIRLAELARDVANAWVRFDPFLAITFATAERIYVTSVETKRLLPAWARGKAEVQLAIGVDRPIAQAPHVRGPEKLDLRLLYVGELRHLKGIHLALKAFAGVAKRFPDARFTIVGHGPAEGWLRGLAQDLEVGTRIDWIGWIPRDQVVELYRLHDLLLFPSLRDSGGMVVLEAMSNGLPALCLRLGGPGIMVDSSCGYVVPADGLAEDVVVADLSGSLERLLANADLRMQLSLGALVRAESLRWARTVETIYGGD